MAALPLTGITTSMVASAIGEASNDVGTLFLSDKVNEWGFNCPGQNNMNAIWGKPPSERAKLSPLNANYTPVFGVMPGYNLGYFRGYDHNWVTYMMGAIVDNFTDYEHALKFKLSIERIPKLSGKPDPSPAVEHTFKLEFARNSNQFDLGTATLINNAFIAVEPYTEFQFEARYPPDYTANGSLDEGEHFFIKATHVSSPDRRWSDEMSDTFIYEFVTPRSTYTNTMEYRNFVITAVKRTATPATTIFKVEADLYADYSSQQTKSFTGTMSTTSNYSANVYNQSDNNVVIQPNTGSPGTKTLVKHLSFDFSLTTLKNLVSVGSTVYGKIVASTGEQYVGSATVTDVVPLQ